MSDEPKITGQEFRKKLAEAITQKSSQTKTSTPEDEAKEYDRKARAAEAKYGYMDTLEKLNNPPGLQEIRMKREHELEEERRRAAEETKELQKREYERLQKEREDASAQASEEHQRSEQLKQQLQDQHNQMLLDKLEELRRSQKPMTEQAKEFFGFAREAAEMLGFEKPDVAKPAYDDPRIALEIKKMDLEQEQRRQEFQWKMEQDRRNFEAKMEEIKIDRYFKEEQLKQQAKKDEMFASLPQTLGGAIAKGIWEKNSHDQSGAVSGPGGVNSSPCPKCGSPIAVGPTSTYAVCSSCNSRFNITRDDNEPKQEPVPAGSETNYEEEEE